MTLVGVVWAMFAPVTLLVLIALVGWGLRRAGTKHAWLLACPLVLAPVAGLYYWDRAGFSAVCKEIGPPRILRRAEAEGVHLNSETAASFGARYVLEEGFVWMERQDISYRSGFVRVSSDGAGGLKEEKIAAVTARYEVREARERVGRFHASIVSVVDRQTGEEMARAGDAYFLGGLTAPVLGAWGSTSCLTTSGHLEHFPAFYHLARNTLRSDAPTETPR